MARQPRIEFPGALYHVMSRGQQREAIFMDERDYDAFRKRLQQMAEFYHLEFYAYCLMPNHYHLFLSTLEGNLKKAMQWLGTAYTVWYNRRHQRYGHLFQGRYKAQLIEGEAYFWEVSRYLHLNPVRWSLVKRPEEWRWSSYRGYWRKAYEESFVNYAPVLRAMCEDIKEARQQYRGFVDAGCGEELMSPWRAAWQGFILGSDEFIEKISALVKDKILPKERDIPLFRKLRKRHTIKEVVGAVAAETGLCEEKILSRAPGERNQVRKMAIVLCRYLCAANGREIARTFGLRSEGIFSRIRKEIDLKEPVIQAILQRLNMKPVPDRACSP